MGGEEVKRSLFYDAHEDVESEYTPSASSSSSEDGESDAEIVSAEELLQDDGVGPLAMDEDEVAFEPQDTRYWSSIQEKKAWIAQFREADRRYVKQFGARLGTSGDPKAKKKLRQQKQWQPVYRLVLTLLVVAYLVAILYRKKPLSPSLSYRNGTNVQTLGDRNQSESADASAVVLIEHLEIQAPADVGSMLHSDTDYVHTGLALCSKLLFRFVDLSHDPTVKRSAIQACDAVVALAARGSLESARAHVLRGDLRSLESEFDAADQDYEQAEAAVKRSLLQTALLENVQHKRLVNRWIQLYTTKKLYKLQKECEDVVLAGEVASLAQQLAEHWLQVLKREKKLLDVLTKSRFVTLQRLVYE